MTILSVTVAEKRKALGLSQRELARAAGVSNATISRLENDQRDYPTIPALQKIACALGLEKNELVMLASGVDQSLPSFEEVMHFVQRAAVGCTDAQRMQLIKCVLLSAEDDCDKN